MIQEIILEIPCCQSQVMENLCKQHFFKETFQTVFAIKIDNSVMSHKRE